MARILRYEPRPVLLPPAMGLARDWYSPRSHLPDVELDESDGARYDRHSVLYDVFLDASNRRLQAIGPPLVNLEPQLMPLRVHVRGEGRPETGPLRARVRRYKRVRRYEIPLPGRRPVEGPLEVRLSFANGFEVRRVVEPCREEPVFLSLSTLQKDNEIAWIVDWMAYYHALGVERICLYDNGSAGFDALEPALAALPESLEVVLVRWPFPYGPVRSHENQFCQRAQLNHCHGRFGRATWSACFDIDEYLVPRRRDFSLRRWLEGQRPWTGLAWIDQYHVPNLRRGDASRPPTIRDFPYRTRALSPRLPKYFLRTRAHRFSRAHGAVVRPWLRRRIDPAELVFFHYRGLTTNWKRACVDRLRPVEFDPRRHTEDLAVIERLATPGPAAPDGAGGSRRAGGRSPRRSRVARSEPVFGRECR